MSDHTHEGAGNWFTNSAYSRATQATKVTDQRIYSACDFNKSGETWVEGFGFWIFWGQTAEEAEQMRDAWREAREAANAITKQAKARIKVELEAKLDELIEAQLELSAGEMKGQLDMITRATGVDVTNWSKGGVSDLTISVSTSDYERRKRAEARSA